MALEAEHSSTNILDIHPERESIDISIALDTKSKGRRRANSKIYGNVSSSEANQSNAIEIERSMIQSKPQIDLANLVNERNKFIHILVLTSMNDTFERKTLEIPIYPQVLKLGRPNTSQRIPRPRNGYFDSRVISREHAQLTVKEGKIYIDDLNSANGTFLNGVKILKERELKKNDTIELGINIDNDGNKHHRHRRICCETTEIIVWPIGRDSDRSKIFQDLEKTLDSNHSEEQEEDLNGFDSAMFGDITEDLDDVALGVSHDFLSGILVNNNIGTNDNLIKSIRGLINQVHQERVNSLKLASVEQMLNEFKNQLMNNDDALKYQSYKKENEELKKELEESAKEIKIMSENNNKSLKSLNDRNGTIFSLNDEIQVLKDGLKLEQETNITLSGDVKTLQNLLNAKDIDLKGIRNEIINKEKSLKQEIDELKSVIKEKDSLIASFEKGKSKALAKESKQIIVNDIFQMLFVILGVSLIGIGFLKWGS